MSGLAWVTVQCIKRQDLAKFPRAEPKLLETAIFCVGPKNCLSVSRKTFSPAVMWIPAVFVCWKIFVLQRKGKLPVRLSALFFCLFVCCFFCLFVCVCCCCCFLYTHMVLILRLDTLEMFIVMMIIIIIIIYIIVIIIINITVYKRYVKQWYPCSDISSQQKSFAHGKWSLWKSFFFFFFKAQQQIKNRGGRGVDEERKGAIRRVTSSVGEERRKEGSTGSGCQVEGTLSEQVHTPTVERLGGIYVTHYFLFAKKFFFSKQKNKQNLSHKTLRMRIQPKYKCSTK